MSDIHALERTSPKGPGQKFIGMCIKCGATDLTLADMNKPCANPASMDFSDTLAVVMREKGAIQ